MKNFLKIVSFSVFSLYIARAQEEPSLVNFKHLEYLTEKIELYGDTVSIVHIYSNYPGYKWVDAKESGPEGIACVDDAARAAVVLLRSFELTHDSSKLAEARSTSEICVGDGDRGRRVLQFCVWPTTPSTAPERQATNRSAGGLHAAFGACRSDTGYSEMLTLYSHPGSRMESSAHFRTSTR